MEPMYDRVMASAKRLAARLPGEPKLGLIMGSGLGDVGNRLADVRSIPYAEIPGFPRSTAPGHEGNLLSGRMAGHWVALLQGRFHFYEGYSTQEVTFPIRVLAAVGAKFLVVTNASGGLNPLFRQGQIMAMVDHIHLIPENPLRGLEDERLGERFPDLSRAYDPDLLALAETVALKIGIPLQKGVYAGVPGPSLETPAETRLLRAAGADAVGMSTTSEVIVARSLGLRVLGLSVISNVNRPDCMAPILVQEILTASREATPRLLDLIEGVLRDLPVTP